MSKVPQYIKEGWRPHGPGLCRCPRCGAVTSTNALGRARHDCASMLDQLRSDRDAAAARGDHAEALILNDRIRNLKGDA